MRRRIKNILIGFDQLTWVVFTLGAGSPDETISAAAWRMERDGKLAGRLLRPIIDVLFLPLDRHHCYGAYASELLRQQLPAAYRNGN